MGISTISKKVTMKSIDYIIGAPGSDIEHLPVICKVPK